MKVKTGYLKDAGIKDQLNHCGRKYTVGELAELVGISSRTIRFYDKKGLLVPVEHSSGGYRLYNEDSVMQLQTIRMLQYIGLSLQEIKEYLKKEENVAWEEMLRNQKLMLEEKKHRMEQMIFTLDEMIYDCQTGETRENEVERAVNILRLMDMESQFDYRYFFYEQYSTREQEWFEWTFDRLELFEGVKVLDMGCGHGNIWVRNWDKIPQGAAITFVDKRNSALEYLENFFKENQNFLQKDVQFHFVNQDLENDFVFKEQYDRIVADHLWTFISQPEKLMKKACKALLPDGFMHSTYNSYGFMETVQQFLEKIGIPMDLKESIQRQTKRRLQFENNVESCFPKVTCDLFENKLEGIGNAEVIFQYIQNHDLPFYTENQASWKKYEQEINWELQKEGALTVSMTAPLYRCYSCNSL